MTMSDCGRCWDTPCSCGWGYRNWNLKHLDKQIKTLQVVRIFKQCNPDTNFSVFDHEEKTPDDERLIEVLNKHYYAQQRK